MNVLTFTVVLLVVGTFAWFLGAQYHRATKAAERRLSLAADIAGQRLLCLFLRPAGRHNGTFRLLPDDDEHERARAELMAVMMRNVDRFADDLASPRPGRQPWLTAAQPALLEAWDDAPEPEAEFADEAPLVPGFMRRAVYGEKPVADIIAAERGSHPYPEVIA